jgi:hypothetical protein
MGMLSITHQLKDKQSLWVGALLIIVSVFLGVCPLYYGVFGDEGDKIAVGWLIQDGSVLYRDIFSHHFPFVYYWVAAVFGIGGHSLLAVRLSVLCFQVLAFSLAFFWTRMYVGVGLAAILWSFLKILFAGQMALYNTFAATALMPLFLLALHLLVEQQPPPRWSWLIGGMLSAISFLSDPLAVLPLLVIAFVLSTRREYWLFVVQTGGIFLLLCLVVGVLFASVSSFDEWYQNAVLFNVQVYNRYYNLRPDRIQDLLSIAGLVLQVAQPSVWTERPSLWIGSQHPFDVWLLGGFAFRCLFLLITARFLLQRKFRAALLVYLMAVVLLFRSEVFFRALPFVFCGVALFSFLARAEFRTFPYLRHSQDYKDKVRLRTMFITMLHATMLVLFCVVVWRGGMLFLTAMPSFSYAQNFRVYEERVASLGLQNCQDEVRLAYYPGDPYIYFFANVEPLNRYLFFYPWVAEVGVDEALSSFVAGETQASIVYIQRDGSIWGRQNAQYMAPLLNYLERSYSTLDRNTFYSPAFRAICQ